MRAVVAAWRHPEFSRGARDISSISLGMAAWGLVTGIALIKGGLPLSVALLMTFTVYAGSAQLAVTPLIVHGAPYWVIWATAFCVNMRFVIFSAGWRPYFAPLRFWPRMGIAYLTGDLNYIAFMRRFPKPEPMPMQLAYFFGGVTVNWLAWQISSIAGMLLANVIPTGWGIDFAGALALVGLTGTLLLDRGTWIAAAVAACAALAAFALPFHLNIVVAIAAAIAIGVLMDHYAAPAASLKP